MWSLDKDVSQVNKSCIVRVHFYSGVSSVTKKDLDIGVIFQPFGNLISMLAMDNLYFLITF